MERAGPGILGSDFCNHHMLPNRPLLSPAVLTFFRQLILHLVQSVKTIRSQFQTFMAGKLWQMYRTMQKPCSLECAVKVAELHLSEAGKVSSVDTNAVLIVVQLTKPLLLETH